MLVSGEACDTLSAGRRVTHSLTCDTLSAGQGLEARSEELSDSVSDEQLKVRLRYGIAHINLRTTTLQKCAVVPKRARI